MTEPGYPARLLLRMVKLAALRSCEILCSCASAMLVAPVPSGGLKDVEVVERASRRSLHRATLRRSRW